MQKNVCRILYKINQVKGLEPFIKKTLIYGDINNLNWFWVSFMYKTKCPDDRNGRTSDVQDIGKSSNATDLTFPSCCWHGGSKSFLIPSVSRGWKFISYYFVYEPSGTSETLSARGGYRKPVFLVSIMFRRRSLI